MKTLIIMRHAKSDWNAGAIDFERPLNKRGKKDAPFMGEMLNKMGIIPEIIISSSAVRAITTARLFAENCGCNNKIISNDNFYGAEPEHVIREIIKLDSAVNVAMVVGHNPTMEDLVSDLCSDGSMNIKFPTASIAILRNDYYSWDSLGRGMMYLHSFFIPKALHHFIS